MNREIPILMIGLQIPLLPDTNVDQILEAIRTQLASSIDEVRRQQAAEAEAAEQREFAESLPVETKESYTDQTREDLLARLGYAAEE